MKRAKPLSDDPRRDFAVTGKEVEFIAGLEADGPSDRVPVHSRTAGEDLRTCQSPDVWIRLATRIPSLVVNSPLLAAKSQKKAPRQKRRMENRISAF